MKLIIRILICNDCRYFNNCFLKKSVNSQYTLDWLECSVCASTGTFDISIKMWYNLIREGQPIGRLRGYSLYIIEHRESCPEEAHSLIHAIALHSYNKQRAFLSPLFLFLSRHFCLGIFCFGGKHEKQN